MRATVKDVAKLAGVSPKTVSNVVNRTVPVSPATRARVESALAALDYVPNLSARGLRNGRTGVIALALPDLSTPYSAAVVQAFVRSGKARGFSVHVEETTDADTEAALLTRAREHLVDGLVLNPVLLEASAVRLAGSLPPVVMIGEVDEPAVDHVWVDNAAAVHSLVTALVRSGRRRVAVLGVMRSASSDLRTEGYRRALREAGLPHDPELEIPSAEWSSQGGHDAMTAVLARGTEVPDAVVCFTDTLALGVAGALQRRGVDVPGRVAVCGYDDVEVARWVSPSLTTVSFDRQAVAEAALDLLTARMERPDAPVETRTVPHRIVVRDSSGPLPLG
ncbi:LacI family transcriptional regulator [Desertihabitans brevis]|uniref:LacI family transcriptional regulator n=1 Tax=Desertihabitans brevis TaxID=2268447 RepID=A0A367YXL6_9ACTN|nr:LacI family DNA-binding transcriptional regulator [Desertihabitans brevis]RCK70636.1 LacI family transcriptional regulator [Desertihabitans brevis]